ncbi:MAG: DinB family protein [Gemmatimonadales bacterium]|nr:MAG: DinB family protein [Gemmatimonadales bacterium]
MNRDMPLPTIRALMLRELNALRREIEAYPDDASIWTIPSGIANSGGTLALHIAGNLQHFVGAILGDTGYVRDRAAEFEGRALGRDRILEEIEFASRAIDATLTHFDPGRLDDPYPVEVGGSSIPTRDFLMHLASHLSYHLGQVDYHRRIVTGEGRTVGTQAIPELRVPEGS